MTCAKWWRLQTWNSGDLTIKMDAKSSKKERYCNQEGVSSKKNNKSWKRTPAIEIVHHSPKWVQREIKSSIHGMLSPCRIIEITGKRCGPWIWCIIWGVRNHRNFRKNGMWQNDLEKPNPVTNHVGGHCNDIIPIIVAYIGISSETILHWWLEHVGKALPHANP